MLDEVTKAAVRAGAFDKATEYGNELLSERRAQPRLNSFDPDMTLAQELLEKGEREVFLQYFALCRRFWASGSQQPDVWSKTVREGGTPKFGANLP